MKRAIASLDKGIAYLSHAGRIVGCFFIFITALIITTNSVSRYILNYPLAFSDDYSRYMFVGIVYLGLGYTLRVGGHVSADLFVSKLSKKTRNTLGVITSSVGTIVIIAMLWYGWKAFIYAYTVNLRETSPLESPLWVPHLFLAVGVTIFLLDMLVHIVRGTYRLLKGEPSLS